MSNLRLETGWSRELGSKEISGFRVEKPISEGANTCVYRAYQVSMRRYVALRVLSPALASIPSLKQEFIKLAKTFARVDHPAIARIYNIEDKGEVCYYSMEYCEGQSLSDLLALKRKLSQADSVGLVLELSSVSEEVSRKSCFVSELPSDKVMLTERSGLKILPGCLRSGKSEKQSIRALGLLLIELLTGTPPSREVREGRFSPEEMVEGASSTETRLKKVLVGSVRGGSEGFERIADLKRELSSLLDSIEAEGEEASILKVLRPRKRISTILSACVAVLSIVLCVALLVGIVRRTYAKRRLFHATQAYRQLRRDVPSLLRAKKFRELDSRMGAYEKAYPDSPYIKELRLNRTRLSEIIRYAEEMERRRLAEQARFEAQRRQLMQEWDSVKKRLKRLIERQRNADAVRLLQDFLPVAESYPKLKRGVESILKTLLAKMKQDLEDTTNEARQEVDDRRFGNAIIIYNSFLERWDNLEDSEKKINGLIADVEKKAEESWKAELKKAERWASAGEFEVAILLLRSASERFGLDRITEQCRRKVDELKKRAESLDVPIGNYLAERSHFRRQVNGLRTVQLKQLNFDQVIDSLRETEKKLTFPEFKTRSRVLLKSVKELKGLFERFVGKLNDRSIRGFYLTVGVGALPLLKAFIDNVTVGSEKIRVTKRWAEVEPRHVYNFLKRVPQKPEEYRGLFLFCLIEGLRAEAYMALTAGGLKDNELAPLLWAWEENSPPSKPLERAVREFEAQLYLKCAVLEHLAGRRKIALYYTDRVKKDFPGSRAARIINEFFEILKTEVSVIEMPLENPQKEKLLEEAERAYASAVNSFYLSLAETGSRVTQEITNAHTLYTRLFELDATDPLVKKRLIALNLMQISLFMRGRG